jgi:hypothetical protein
LGNLGGKLAALQGDDALAEEAMMAAVEAEPGHEAFARDLASFLADRDRIAEALAVIDRALPLTVDIQKLARLRERLLSIG